MTDALKGTYLYSLLRKIHPEKKECLNCYRKRRRSWGIHDLDRKGR